MSYSIGDKLVLNDNRQGVIVYMGSIQRKKGTYYGLILTKGKGDVDGSIGMRRYFRCRKGEGAFVKKSEIKSSLFDNTQMELEAIV